MSWARTWAVVAADILLVARLVAETSAAAAALFVTLAVVPVAGLILVRTRHAQRVDRFRRGTAVHHGEARGNLALVALVVTMAATGLAAVVCQALQ